MSTIHTVWKADQQNIEIMNDPDNFQKVYNDPFENNNLELLIPGIQVVDKAYPYGREVEGHRFVQQPLYQGLRCPIAQVRALENELSDSIRTTLSEANLQFVMRYILLNRSVSQIKRFQNCHEPYFQETGGDHSHFLPFEDAIIGFLYVAIKQRRNRVLTNSTGDRIRFNESLTELYNRFMGSIHREELTRRNLHSRIRVLSSDRIYWANPDNLRLERINRQERGEGNRSTLQELAHKFRLAFEGTRLIQYLRNEFSSRNVLEEFFSTMPDIEELLDHV